MIFNKLAEDVLEDGYFKDLYNKLTILSIHETFSEKTNESLSKKEKTHLYQFSDILSNSKIPEARNIAYRIISFLNNDDHEDPVFKTYSTAILSRLGNFPAMKHLGYNVYLPFVRELEKNVKEVVQKVPGTENMIFTDSQYSLFTKLKESNCYSFSGPTSMGKSFIIKRFIFELLDNKAKGNIAIIVPTRALINQFSIEIKKDLKQTIKKNNYRVISNSNISDLALMEKSKFILVLTPERLISYLSEKENPPLEYLFVDEAHKLTDEKDYRSITLYSSIEQSIKKYNDIKLYFSAPNVSNPEIFLKLFNKDSSFTFKTTESPVSQNIFFIDLLEKKVVCKSKFSDYSFNPKIIRDYSDSLDAIYHLGHNQSNIIYCSSVRNTIDMARNFAYRLRDEDLDFSEKEKNEIRKAIKITREFIHKDYYLIECLEKGVGFHFGKLPQLIRNSIESLYKRGVIKNLFCTSTLLEGVNLPAKNMFVLNNKKGSSNMTDLDFRNLGGRAGRLNVELYGNVFCIRDNLKSWKNTDIIDVQPEIKLETSITSKMDKRIKKIEGLLLDPDIKIDTNKEKEILKYIANIICIDTLELRSNYKSPVITKLIEDKKDKIIEYAKDIMNENKVPKEVVSSNQSIMVRQQNKVYNYMMENRDNPEIIKLPKQVEYDSCLGLLNKFYVLYNWEKNERNRKNLHRKESLKYYAALMNMWINGNSLNSIIMKILEYNHDNNRKIYYYQDGKRKQAIFDIHNVIHVNQKINNIIDNIEGVLRFVLEKYFNNYHSLLQKFLGEEEAGENWANYLEYGTRNSLIISLQNLGFSRHVAFNLVKSYGGFLSIEDGKLVGIKKKGLLKSVPEDSATFDEITTII